MKRNERYEYNYIKKIISNEERTVTMLVEGSKEYKHELYELLKTNWYHPIGITENDSRFYDGQRRLVFIKTLYGNRDDWKSVYCKEEKQLFANIIEINEEEL